MTVESNHGIAISTLSDWFKNLAPVYQPVRRKTKSTKAHAIFLALNEQVTWNIATNLDRFIVLSAPAVIGRSNYYFQLVFVSLN